MTGSGSHGEWIGHDTTRSWSYDPTHGSASSRPNEVVRLAGLGTASEARTPAVHAREAGPRLGKDSPSRQHQLTDLLREPVHAGVRPEGADADVEVPGGEGEGAGVDPLPDAGEEMVAGGHGDLAAEHHGGGVQQ